MNKGNRHGHSKTGEGQIVIDSCWGRIDDKRLWRRDAVSAGTRQSPQPLCAPRQTAKDSKGEILHTEENDLWRAKTCRLRVGKRFLGAEWENYRLHYGDNGLCINGTDHTDQLVRPCRYKQVSTAHHKKRSKNLLLQQGNEITPINIPLLRILDALRLIKEIPACSPDECLTNIRKTIDALSMDLKRDLADLSLAYTPYVRALLGAIYESMGLETENISKSLNGVTSYKLPISDNALPNKRNWNIT